jgi:hypothetical protein
MLYLHASQFVQPMLISLEATGGTEPHSNVAVKDQPKRFPTMIVSDRLAVGRGTIHSWCTVSIAARAQVNFEYCNKFRYEIAGNRATRDKTD